MVEAHLPGREIIGSYYKLSKIGIGGFGECWKVKEIANSGNKEILVMKMIKIQIEEEGIYDFNTAAKEVEILRKLQHQNIIAIQESFAHAGHLCIIMEYAEGGDLFQLIQNRMNANEKFKTREIIKIMLEISEAVSYMHKNKVVHLDLKPRNILFDAATNVKVCDFGISKCMGTQQYASLQSNLTMSYASPERFTKSQYKCEPDIWSLGAILYELLFFKLLFDSPDNFQLVGEILYGDMEVKLEPVKQIHKGIFFELITDMLNKDRKKRIIIADAVEQLQEMAEEVDPNILLSSNNQGVKILMTENIRVNIARGGEETVVGVPLMPRVEYGKRCLNCHTLDPNVNVSKSCGNCKKSLFCTNCIGDYSCERCPNVLWLCQPCKKLLVCSICDFKACEKCFTSCFSPTCPNKTIRICQKCITKCPSCYVGYCKTCTFHILKCPGECKKEGCSSCFKSCKNKLCKHHFCKECEYYFKCPACNKFTGCNRCAEPCSTNDCKYLQCQNTKCPNYIHCATCKKKYCRCHNYFPCCAKCNNLVCLECLKLTNSIYISYCQDSQFEYFDDWRKNDHSLNYWGKCPEEVSVVLAK